MCHGVLLSAFCLSSPLKKQRNPRNRPTWQDGRRSCGKVPGNVGAPLHLPIRTQELLTLSTPHPTRTPSWGTVAVGGLLDSLQHTSELKKMLLLGDSEAFSSVCVSVGGVSLESYFCPLREETNKQRHWGSQSPENSCSHWSQRLPGGKPLEVLSPHLWCCKSPGPSRWGHRRNHRLAWNTGRVWATLTPTAQLSPKGWASEQKTSEEAPEVAFLTRTSETETDSSKPSTVSRFHQADWEEDSFTYCAIPLKENPVSQSLSYKDVIRACSQNEGRKR